MKQFFSVLIYCGLLIGCEAPVELKADPSLLPETLASSSICNEVHCLAFKTEIYRVNEMTYTPVDIVFILDVSRSMEDNLEKISLASSSLTASIEHLDWQITFTTADHGDSQYQCTEGKTQTRKNNKGNTQKFCPREHRIFPEFADSWVHYTGTDPKFGNPMPIQDGRRILNQSRLNSSLPNYENIFRDTITRSSYEKQSPCQWPPFCQGDHEQPLRVLKSIIEQSKDLNQSPLRPPAVLAVFIATDEKERAADFKNATTAREVIDTFNTVFQDHPDKKMIVYGISILNPSCLEKQHTVEADYSQQLNQLVSLTKGMSIDICQDSYQSAFSDISKRLRRYVSQIPLEFTPVITQHIPISVKVFDTNGVPMQVKWERNFHDTSISFAEVLPPGTQVEVSYYYRKPS